MSFAHLNVHTEFSMVDSTVRLKPLVQRIETMGMPAVAVTDFCNLFAMVKFVRAAQGLGIKPIIGADVRVAATERNANPWQLTLLVQNQQGYLSLCRLLSRMYLKGQTNDGPMAQAQWVHELNDGLIALSGCNSDVGRHLIGGHYRQAADQLGHWRQAFGDRFYLELTRCGRNDDIRHSEAAIDLAARSGCPVVASNAVRFLDTDDFEAHEARVCIHSGRVLGDPKRPKNYTAEQYLKSPQVMQELFADCPEAIANTLHIATRCTLELNQGEYFLPAFTGDEGESEDDYLRKVSNSGLQQRLDARGPFEGYTVDDYQARLDIELDVIIQMGFPGYFLIVADFIQWAKDQNIPVGPGRGSGAGSVVAWALKITDLDPLEFDLLFERFLNPERVSMPDFDIDFCMDRRDEVIDYVARKYGRDHVSQIITYGTMAAKAVVRDTGRVLGHPFGFVDSIAKQVPMQLGITLSKALDETAELKERYDTDEDVRDLLDLALKLEGLTRNAGKHAGGVVIAPQRLVHYAPLYAEAGGESVVTQFDKDDVESIGLVKFDFLGLRTLTIIDWALEAINQRRKASGEQPLSIETIAMDDEPTFELLRKCDTTAVFQLESRGMKELVRRLQPDRFDDLIALVALFRPGPLESGMVGTYVDCKHGREQVKFPHPSLEAILSPTHGVILYQEQVMQIAQVLSGYTLGGADLLRRAMGKKKAEEMAKQRTIFVSGAEKNGVEATTAENIFDLIEKFAGYGFNKSHSAAYALLAYQTAYLKAHYPAEFMAAVLSADMDSTDKVVALVEDCRQGGLVVHPPDVNRSFYRFVAGDENEVIYGLGAVKGAGAAAIEGLAQEREANGRYTDLLDLCRRNDLSKLNKRVLEVLVLSGSMDGFGVDRANLMAQLPSVLKAAEQEVRDRNSGQTDMFGAPRQIVMDTCAEVAEWSLLERLKGERQTLGLYLTGHPLDPWREDLKRFTSGDIGSLGAKFATQLANARPRSGPEVIISGQVLSVRRRSERAAFVALDDQTGRIEAACFGDVIAEHADLLVPDRLLVVGGILVNDDFSGGQQLRAKQVYDVEQAQAQFARALRIHLDGEAIDIQQMKEILAQYRPGTAPVWIRYLVDGATTHLELGDEWRISACNALVEQLSQLPGVELARIEY